MPTKPVWYGKLSRIIEGLQSSPHPFVDRAEVEFLLGVGRRRAQQIMAPCITRRIGANGLADRDALIARLRRLAGGNEVAYEIRRRRKLAEVVERLRQERLERPQLLVEAPVQVVDSGLGNLPPGVYLDRGKITVEFTEPQQALEKLLALAMAIGNDFAWFERQARGA